MNGHLITEAVRRGIITPTDRTLEKYGLTAEAWLALLESQGWVCPICLRSHKRWNVDHDHVPKWKTMPPELRVKYVRGILCWHCNHKRVNSRMSSEEATRIAEYLRRYEERRDS